VRQLTYTVHLEPEPEGGFTVTVPALPGCVTWGGSYEHALAMAREAIEGWLAVLAARGKPIPVERQKPVAVDLAVEVPAPTSA
jgi:predicted RNase H-like HicB family nuclease